MTSSGRWKEEKERKSRERRDVKYNGLLLDDYEDFTFVPLSLHQHLRVDPEAEDELPFLAT